MINYDNYDSRREKPPFQLSLRSGLELEKIVMFIFEKKSC